MVKGASAVGDATPKTRSLSETVFSEVEDLVPRRVKSYRVVVYGRNFRLAWQEGRKPVQARITGFFATRFVRARNRRDAELRAMDLIRTDKQLVQAVRNRLSDPPIMFADSIVEVPSFKAVARGSAAIYLARTMGEVAASMNSSVRFVSILLSIFGGLALLLVAVGVYGTLSCIVNARRVEFGVRRAIGASAPSLLALVMRDAMRPAVAGVAIGLLLAVWFGQVLASQVRGTPGPDAWVFAGVGALLLVTAAGSALWPALRAARVDPVIAMRGES
jgi:ABC-type lipoprotein release transport system permease subunit